MDYKFKINDFEGPLDLLLHLIKESKMDIFNIEIVSLTNQYLDFISHMEELNLSIASSYLVMASELMYMKSNYLLPRPEKEDEDEIDAKEELINRLIEYKKYKETTPILKQLEEERKDLFTKEYLAVVNGYLENDYGVFEDYIEKTNDNSSIISKNGKYAKLEYEVLKKNNNLSLVL